MTVFKLILMLCKMPLRSRVVFNNEDGDELPFDNMVTDKYSNITDIFVITRRMK